MEPSRIDEILTKVSKDIGDDAQLLYEYIPFILELGEGITLGDIYLHFDITIQELMENV